MPWDRADKHTVLARSRRHTFFPRKLARVYAPLNPFVFFNYVAKHNFRRSFFKKVKTQKQKLSYKFLEFAVQ